jgi:DNA-binding transcriptional LysR family regulator
LIVTEHLKGIGVFVQAADAGSFTLAGERLGISKSGVAKSIARLEEQLGVRLFNRTTRSLSLTDEGQTFYQGCVRALAELEGAQSAVTTRQQIPAGRLRVDLPVVFGRRWVLPVLLDVAARYPALELDVTLTDRRVDMVEEGIDLVIRIGALDDSATLVARHLGVQKSVVCASPGYLDTHGRPASLEDLADHACITFGRGSKATPWLFIGADGRPLSYPVRGHLGFNHSEAILDAALAGHGLALLSNWLVAEHLTSGRLEAVLPQATTQGFPIHALWPQTRHLTTKVRVVVDELMSRFLPVSPWDVV